MIDKGVFYGANRAQTLSATDTFQGAEYSIASPTSLNIGVARVWTIDNAGGDVNLPPANGDSQKVGRIGGPSFMIINIMPSTAFDVKDDGGTVIQNVVAGKAVLICLADNSTANGTWLKHLMQVA